MSVEQPSPEMQEATQRLYGLAIELTNDCLICASEALDMTKRRLEIFSKSNSADSIDIEAIIEIFINYRCKPNLFNQFETKAILGHALIIRVLGSDAAHRIGQAYIEWQGHAKPMCTAFLMWVGDNPELADIDGKVFLHPNLADSLLLEASGRLTQRVQLSNPSYALRQRLSSDMLSQCNIPDCVQLALDADRNISGGTLTNQKLLSELQYVADRVQDAEIKSRVEALLQQIVGKIDAR